MVAVVRTERDGNAGVDLHGDRIQRERFAQGLEQTTRQRPRGNKVRACGRQDCEFVITCARKQILTTDAVRQTIRDVAQQIVAKKMTDRVVDLLELIEMQ